MSGIAKRVVERYLEKVTGASRKKPKKPGKKPSGDIPVEDLGIKALRKKWNDEGDLSDADFEYLERHMYDSPAMHKLWREVTGS
jgi:hypothetical protein